MGLGLEILPRNQSRNGEWLAIAHFLLTVPTGQRSRGRVTAGPEAIGPGQDGIIGNRTGGLPPTHGGIRYLAALPGNGVGEYPTPSSMSLEVAYNQWAPFRFCLGTAWWLPWPCFFTWAAAGKFFNVAAWAAFLASVAAMIAGFCFRMAISGRCSVTNMYESVVYVAWGSPSSWLVFELIYRRNTS